MEEREQALLKVADVVFCGGKKLHEAKSLYHNNAHFYGCGVDVEHFFKARSAYTPLPADVADLPRPIFGYYGVIDERLDYELISELARSTEGSVIMVGPLAKVEESQLPRHTNLHWLGKRAYEELPSYAKAFDVCLMPFALNEATEYINPTKALEYLGAGRPVVSTRVSDVVSLFSDVVSIAENPRAFINTCVSEARSFSKHRQRLGICRAKANSWDSIVTELESHIKKALLVKSGGKADYSYSMETSGAR